MTISSPPDLLASYRPLPGAYDEMLAADGRLRVHWAHAARVIETLGLGELLDRRSEAYRLLDDDGVTYNVYGDDPAMSATAPTIAPWGLDPVPILLASDEWARIEQGVIQRAELFNLVLTDLYGPRQLLRRGLLPAEQRSALRKASSPDRHRNQPAPSGSTSPPMRAALPGTRLPPLRGDRMDRRGRWSLLAHPFAHRVADDRRKRDVVAARLVPQR